MENEAKPKVDIYQWVVWADANRKRLIVIAALIVGIGAIIGIYAWHNAAHEADANDALSVLPVPATVRPADLAAVAAQYAKVADDYSDTSAGARAMLLGAGLNFDAGQPAKAQSLFEHYLQAHANYPLTGEALLGLAACLEAQGKTADAIARYEDLLKSHSSDSITPQAKSALAQLYMADNKPDRALHLYDEMLAANNNSSWSMEAQIRGSELLANHPDLRKPPPMPAAAATLTNEPGLLLPGGAPH